MGRKTNSRVAGALSAMLGLAACAGVEAAAPDSAPAAGMSLGEARLIVKNRSTTDFLPDGVVVGDNPAAILSCRYEALNPALQRQDGKDVVDWGPQCRYRLTFPENESANARQFAVALLRWKVSTLEERKIWNAIQYRQFLLNAESYRAAGPKPALPEEVRRLKVRAEAAVNEKRFADAARAYEIGVEMAPWWAEGHFNAALVLGEIHHYAAAIDHMRKYLILKPDANDARAAQDQIYAWGGEAASPVPGISPSVQLGVSVDVLRPDVLNALQKPDMNGALVVGVIKGSVAEKTGISKGDVIVEYGGKPILNGEDLLIAVFTTKPNSAVPIKIMRGTQELILTAQF